MDGNTGCFDIMKNVAYRRLQIGDCATLEFGRAIKYTSNRLIRTTSISCSHNGLTSAS